MTTPLSEALTLFGGPRPAELWGRSAQNRSERTRTVPLGESPGFPGGNPRTRARQRTGIRLRCSLELAEPRLSKRVLFGALPAGSTIARSQGSWLRQVEEHRDTFELRADALANLMAVAREVSRSADWRTLTARPTWDRLCDRTDLSRRTVARWLAWLREHGLLGLLESGTTARWRPRAASALTGNRAAVYLLAVPADATPQVGETKPVETTGTPSQLLTEGESKRARADGRESPLRGPDQPSRALSGPIPSLHQAPTNRGERLISAQTLQMRIPALRGLSDRHLRHLLRPWFVAGWTPADVLYALDHAPSQEAHTWTTAVRSPAGWLRHRLALWTNDAGAPLEALSRARARTHEQREQTRAAELLERQKRDELRQAEEAFARRVRILAGDSWPTLAAAVCRAHGLPSRHAGGRMVEALIVGKVRAHYGGNDRAEDGGRTNDMQLLGALAAVLEESTA